MTTTTVHPMPEDKVFIKGQLYQIDKYTVGRADCQNNYFHPFYQKMLINVQFIIVARTVDAARWINGSMQKPGTIQE